MKRLLRIHVLVLVLLFLSGASALVYEVIWQRMLGLVLGNTTFATATIVASFMGGLALGSFYFGRRIDKYKKPLALFAYLEIAIAVFAILFPIILSGVSAIYVNLSQLLGPAFYLSSVVKSGIAFLVLLFPSFLMGGTLPIVGRFLLRRSEKPGQGVGGLYGSNTLGGVLGAFSAGFFLITLLGVRETTYVAAGVNVLVAGVALGLNRFLVSDDSGSPERTEEKVGGTNGQAYPGYISNVVLLVYAVSGFCALAYEVLWTRVLVLSLGNTTYVFTTMLTTFLFGLALGSLVFAKFLDRGRHALVMLGCVEALIGVSVIVSMWQFGEVEQLVNETYIVLGGGWPGIIGTRYIGSLLIMFVPTLLMGMAFPLAYKIYVKRPERLGQGIGNLYSANTLGAVVGSLAAGFVLIPSIGIMKSIMLIALVNLVLATIILSCCLFARYRVRATAVLMGVTLLAMIAAIVRPGIVLQSLQYGEELVFYEEGSSATVAVVENEYGVRTLKVNGVSEVPTEYYSLRAFHMLGHLPMLLHDDPQKVLVVAFGAGIAAGAVAKHPVARIDVVELSHEVINANKYFLEENHVVLEDPRVNLIIEDGRNYLLRSQEHYDVISSDATHPLVSDSWVLYTREFYELARERLAPGGIMAQWLPLHSVAPEDLKTIVRTFQTVFPNTTLWFTGEYCVLVGTEKEFAIDFTLLMQRLGEQKIGQDLGEYHLGDAFSFLSSFLMSKESVARYSRGTEINTDDHPVIQFGERRSKGNVFPQNLADLWGFRESVFPLLANLGKEATAIETQMERYYRSGTQVMRAQVFGYQGMLLLQLEAYRIALYINPEDDNARYLLGVAEANIPSLEP